jgi:hypothetical protein
VTYAELRDELRRIGDELVTVRRLVERLVPPAQPGQIELLEQLAQHFNDNFRSSEVIDLASLQLSTREPLRQVLDALGVANDAQKLGMVLSALVKSTIGRPVRLVCAGKDGNANLWLVEREPGG